MTSTARHYDAIVIGAGSGGVRAARIAASLGAHVAIVEERFFGGTCVNVGCVPKKMFAYAAGLQDNFALAADYGLSVGKVPLDWDVLRDNKTREIERLNGIYRQLLEKAGVVIVEGSAQITGPGTVQVGDLQLTAPRILIATGGTPFLPDIPGRDLALISDNLFYLPQLPERVAVVGGGYIATEFAGILNGLGASVTQLYRGDQILRGFDDDIRNHVAEQMQQQGVRLTLDTDVTRIEAVGEGRRLHLSNGETLEVDAVFYATGRTPKVAGLFAAGAAPALTEQGAVVVNAEFETSVPGLFAVGDVIDRVQLTPVALAEGMWWARQQFGNQRDVPPPSYENIPTAVFSHPPIGTVGLTEADARARHANVKIYRSRFRPLKYTLGNQQHRTLMKLVIDADSDKVLGLHMSGDDAAEIVQGFAVAVVMGATKADFDRTIGIHPTSAEEFVTMRD